MTNKCAIVFNCDYNGLSIIQELGTHGIECIAMDSKRSIGTYSKYARFVKCPNPLYQEDEFVHFIFEYCEKRGDMPILFPTNDHWAVAISKYKQELSSVSIPCVADWEVTENLIKKNKFYALGEKKGYLTPRTWNTDRLHEISKKNFPLVAKPIIKIISSNRNVSNLVKNMDRLRFSVIKTRTELNEFIEKERDFLEYLLFQEYVQGMSDSMYSIGIYANNNSEIMGIFTGHKVRGYPADSGDCIVGEKADVPEYVIDNTKRIVKEQQYSGIAEFEYKKDTETGQFKLIEVNPRSWSWIGITPASGVNLPLIAYNDLSGISLKTTGSNTKNETVKYVKVLKDFKNCIFRYKKDYPPWVLSITDWKNGIKAEKVIYAEFHAWDWFISIIALYNETMDVLNTCLKKLRIKD